MLLKDKSLKCDFSGTVYKEKFIYYPVEFYQVQVASSKKYVYPPRLSKEHDMGEEYYNKFMEIMRKYVKDLTKTAIPCSTCDNMMKGDFWYYYVKIHQVVVDLTNQENATTVTKDIMDARICKSCGDRFLGSVLKVESDEKKGGIWS